MKFLIFLILASSLSAHTQNQRIEQQAIQTQVTRHRPVLRVTATPTPTRDARPTATRTPNVTATRTRTPRAQ